MHTVCRKIKVVLFLQFKGPYKNCINFALFRKKKLLIIRKPYHDQQKQHTPKTVSCLPKSIFSLSLDPELNRIFQLLFIMKSYDSFSPQNIMRYVPLMDLSLGTMTIYPPCCLSPYYQLGFTKTLPLSCRGWQLQGMTGQQKERTWISE